MITKQLGLIVLLTLMACSKENTDISKASRTQYVGEYDYASATLNPGDGSITVPALTILKCFDQAGKEVDLSLCPAPTDAPNRIIESPAGTVTIAVSGAVGGMVQIPVAKGERFANLPENEIEVRMEDNIVCEAGYVQYEIYCRIPGHELIFSNYSAPSLTSVCSGTEVLSRSVIGCRDLVTLLDTDITVCDDKVDSNPTQIYYSPAGVRNRTAGINTIIEACDAGATSWNQTDIICGNPDQHKQGPNNTAICVDDTFAPSDFVYPVNNLTAGQGSQTVSAISFTTCTNITKSTNVILDKCGIPTSMPTQVQLSPIGARDILSGVNTIHQQCAEGDTICVQTDITCGNPEQHKEGSGSSATCEDDVFVASNFTYPTNDMNVGDGSRVVDAVGFNSCVNTTKSVPANVAKCLMPLPKPTQTQFSPAGDYSVTVTGAVGGAVLVLVDMGEDWDALGSTEQESRISSLLVCASGYTKNAHQCIINEYITKIHVADKHVCTVTNIGNAKCRGYYSPYGDIYNSLPMSKNYSNIVDSVSDIYTVKLKTSSGNYYSTNTNPDYLQSEGYIALGNLTGVDLYFNLNQLTCRDNNSSGRCGGSNMLTMGGVTNPTFGDITTGFTACGISTINGTVVCLNTGVSLAPLKGTSDKKDLALGKNHFCVVSTSNIVSCTGYSTEGQNNFSGTSARLIGAGDSATCVVKTDNTVWCVGRLQPDSFLNYINSITPIRYSELEF